MTAGLLPAPVTGACPVMFTGVAVSVQLPGTAEAPVCPLSTTFTNVRFDGSSVLVNVQVTSAPIARATVGDVGDTPAIGVPPPSCSRAL